MIEIVFALIQTVVSSFIVKVMWLWFMVPLGVKTIGMAHAFGLSCLCIVIGLIKVRLNDKRSVIELVISGLIVDGFTFGLGFIAHLLM